MGQLLVIYFPPLQKVFQTESLSILGKHKSYFYNFYILDEHLLAFSNTFALIEFSF